MPRLGISREKQGIQYHHDLLVHCLHQGCHYCFYGNYCYRNITVNTVADFEEITVTVFIYRNFFIRL